MVGGYHETGNKRVGKAPRLVRSDYVEWNEGHVGTACQGEPVGSSGLLLV